MSAALNLPDERTLPLAMTVNGRTIAARAEPRTNLADFLRDGLDLTGTHLGCEHGVCGACTILLDGEPARSCLTFALACDGSNVETIEGLDHDDITTELRAAFTREHALQCGYCTPGMLTTLIEFLRDNPDPTEQEVRIAISGNLCRCTGYQNIVIATLDAAKRLQGVTAKPA